MRKSAIYCDSCGSSHVMDDDHVICPECKIQYPSFRTLGGTDEKLGKIKHRLQTKRKKTPKINHLLNLSRSKAGCSSEVSRVFLIILHRRMSFTSLRAAGIN